MPDCFFTEHPLGTVIGRGGIKEGFICLQGCTIGASGSPDTQLTFPSLGRNVIMMAHSAIVGECAVGDNVVLGINTIVKKEKIPSNCFVFGESPNLIIKRRSKEDMDIYISGFWK